MNNLTICDSLQRHLWVVVCPRSRASLLRKLPILAMLDGMAYILFCQGVSSQSDIAVGASSGRRNIRSTRATRHLNSPQYLTLNVVWLFRQHEKHHTLEESPTESKPALTQSTSRDADSPRINVQGSMGSEVMKAFRAKLQTSRHHSYIRKLQS